MTAKATEKGTASPGSARAEGAPVREPHNPLYTAYQIHTLAQVVYHELLRGWRIRGGVTAPVLAVPGPPILAVGVGGWVGAMGPAVHGTAFAPTRSPGPVFGYR